MTTTEQPTNDHAIVRVTDDGVFYRASALGGCFRALWAARNGHSPKAPPDHMQTIFDRGHEIEDLVLDRMVADGWEIYDRQREIILPVPIQSDIPCFIVGHIDALGVPPVGLNPNDPEAHLFEHLVEVKGFGPGYLSKYRSQGLAGFPRYKIQTGAYCMGIPCADMAFTVYDKTTDTYRVDFIENKVTEWQLHALVLATEEMYRTGTLPSCTGEYPCPYYYLHDPKETPVPLAPLGNTLVTARINIDEQIKILEDAKAIVTGQLMQEIGYTEGAPSSYDATDAIVTVVHNPARTDMPKIRELLIAAGEDPDDYLIPGNGWHIRLNPKKDRPSV